MQVETVSVPASDGYTLATTVYQPDDTPPHTVVIINSATAVPQRFYKSLATYLTEQGYTAVTYDYRGIGNSRPDSLKGFFARAKDWALLDMKGILDWAQATYEPQRLFFIGHSYGGQTAGLLPNSEHVDAMVTFSSQSGHWRLQGGNQKFAVGFHVHVTLPLLSHLFGYMPWSKISPAEDLPKGVAIDWARWCRQRRYLLDDQSLPLERYKTFEAPVLAYSFDDDDWGTSAAVDAMMTAYPNLTRQHVIPAETGLKSIGHFGFFRSQSKVLWPSFVKWLEETVPLEQPMLVGNYEV